MQVKLLRVLQERQIRRVGENRTRQWTSACWPPPTGTSSRRSTPHGSGRISTIACGSSRSRTAAARAPRRHPAACAIVSHCHRGTDRAERRQGSHRLPRNNFCAICGQATCASSRMRSSEPSCSRAGSALMSRIFRRRWASRCRPAVPGDVRPLADVERDYITPCSAPLAAIATQAAASSASAPPPSIASSRSSRRRHNNGRW